MIKNLRLHHIGVACKSIEKELKTFELLGYKPVSEIFSDEIQKIKGLFISAPNQPELELLENLNDDGPLTAHLKSGRKFYHFAYETENIEDTTNFLISSGAIFVTPITTATYFSKICFLALRNGMIVELVEKRN